MSAEQRLVRTAPRYALSHTKMCTYFVGRRESGCAAIYQVGADGVEPLRPTRHHGDASFDWHGSEGARMELGHLLISRVTKQRPSRDLRARFALYVLDRLSEDGFVIDADDLARWVRIASDAHESEPEPRPRPSRLARLRARFGASPGPSRSAV